MSQLDRAMTHDFPQAQVGPLLQQQRRDAPVSPDRAAGTSGVPRPVFRGLSRAVWPGPSKEVRKRPKKLRS